MRTKFASMSVVFPAVVAALVTLLLCLGGLVDHYAMSVFMFPLCLGLFVIVMALIAFIAEYRLAGKPARKTTTSPPSEASHGGAAGLLREANTWVQLGCMLALMALCWVLGFVPGIALFVLTYLWRAGWKLWVAALYGAASGLVIWVLFDLVFFTPLPFWPVFMR